MNTYQVELGPKGEIIIPSELQKLLGLFEGDRLELRVDSEGKVSARGVERLAGPLADFFEDLILSDLHCMGCSGEQLKDQIYLKKIQLSTALDQLAEEARTSCEKGKGSPWRRLHEMNKFSITIQGDYKVVLSTRAERDLFKLPDLLFSEVAHVLRTIETRPTDFKRLRGPNYSTYRISFNEKSKEQYRVIYTVFEDIQAVGVLCIGERREIYNWLKGLA